MARKDQRIVPPSGRATERARQMEAREKERAKVKAEQTAMNELMVALYGANAPKLNVDGKPGPATKAVREQMGAFLQSMRPPNTPAGDPTTEINALLAELAKEHGQVHLNHPQTKDFTAGLKGKIEEVERTQPPNGFQSRQLGPDPKAAVVQEPPVDPKAQPIVQPVETTPRIPEGPEGAGIIMADEPPRVIGAPAADDRSAGVIVTPDKPKAKGAGPA